MTTSTAASVEQLAATTSAHSTGGMEMAGPRFLYMSYGCTTPLYRWRLVGANNRPIANGWGSHDSLAACEASVRDLRDRVIAGQADRVADLGSGLWSWRFEVDGKRVAVSARSYHRQRECTYNADAFIAAVPIATASTTVLVLPHRTLGLIRSVVAS